MVIKVFGNTFKCILSIGIFSNFILANTLPLQAQTVINNNNFLNNLNYNYDQPQVPILNGLTGIDVNSLSLETDMGTISNFGNIGQLTQNSNLTGIAQNIRNLIDNSGGSLSGLISGRSQTPDGNFIDFNKLPITINGITSLDKNINLLTPIGNIKVIDGKIDSNSLTNSINSSNLSQLSIGNLGTIEQITGLILSPQGITPDQFNLSQLGFNTQVIQELINNPNNLRLGSGGLTTIPSLPSRIHPGLTAPK